MLLGAETNTISGTPICDQRSSCRLTSSVSPRQRAAGPIAIVNFQAHAGQAQIAAHERIGKVPRRQLLVLAGDVFAPTAD